MQITVLASFNFFIVPQPIQDNIRQNKVAYKQENAYLKFNMLHKFDREFKGTCYGLG